MDSTSEPALLKSQLRISNSVSEAQSQNICSAVVTLLVFQLLKFKEVKARQSQNVKYNAVNELVFQFSIPVIVFKL